MTRRAASRALRGFVAVILIVEIVWVVRNFSALRSIGASENLAERVVSGEEFQASILSRFLASAADSIACAPSITRTAAIAELRLAEISIHEADQRSLDGQLANLERRTRDALTCTPTDSFLWFILYWVEVRLNGLSDRPLKFLQMSYALGPNEGWIAEKRNRLALAVFDRLPRATQHLVIAEYSQLANSGFTDSAVRNLLDADAEMQRTLIASLAGNGLGMKLRFVKALRRQGIFVDIPGVPSKERRPWD